MNLMCFLLLLLEQLLHVKSYFYAILLYFPYAHRSHVFLSAKGKIPIPIIIVFEVSFLVVFNENGYITMMILSMYVRVYLPPRKAQNETKQS